MTNIINKEFMRRELIQLLSFIFNAHEIEKVDIKGISINSLEDEPAITDAINKCYHDMYSDIDINLHIKLNPDDYNGFGTIYADNMRRLGFENDILGLLHNRLENKGELIRVCKTNGMRFDLAIYPVCVEAAPALPHTDLRTSVEKEDKFWFIAIQALGKLMRKDHLIAAHLAHEIIQEGLILQMILRDKEYNTNIHRFGYAEKLDYLDVIRQDEVPFGRTQDETFNYISELLYSAIKSFDRLCLSMNNSYKSRINDFLNIWSCYINV